jgi:protein-tyrosine-phosphatase
MTRKRAVLFLCTGDTCRGPMAAGVLRKILDDAGLKSFEIRSAGVMTVTGLLATPETTQMLKSFGVELDRHRSTPMTVDLLSRSDLILGMTPLHTQQALRTDPKVRARTFLLKEYARSDLKKVQIDDPMGNTLEIYKKVFSEIKTACQQIAKTPFFTGQKPAKPAVAKKKASKKTARKTAKKAAKRAAKKTAARKSATRKSAAPKTKRATVKAKTAKTKPAKKATAKKTAKRATVKKTAKKTK